MVSRLEQNFEVAINLSNKLIKSYSTRLAHIKCAIKDYNTQITTATSDIDKALTDEDYCSAIKNRDAISALRRMALEDADYLNKSLEGFRARFHTLSSICPHDNVYFDEGIRIYRCKLCDGVA